MSSAKWRPCCPGGDEQPMILRIFTHNSYSRGLSVSCDLNRIIDWKKSQRLGFRGCCRNCSPCGSRSWQHHHNDVIMSAVASQIISLTIVYSTVYSGADQRKYQNPASPAFVRGNHQWPVNMPHKGPVMRKMFPSDDVIMVKIADHLGPVRGSMETLSALRAHLWWKYTGEPLYSIGIAFQWIRWSYFHNGNC